MMRLLLGRRYNRAKRRHGSEPGTNRRDDGASGQSDHMQERTAESIATQHGVSEKTVRRAALLALLLAACSSPAEPAPVECPAVDTLPAIMPHPPAPGASPPPCHTDT